MDNTLHGKAKRVIMENIIPRAVPMNPNTTELLEYNQKAAMTATAAIQDQDEMEEQQELLEAQHFQLLRQNYIEQQQLQKRQHRNEVLLQERQQQTQDLTTQQKVVSPRKQGFTEIDQRPETLHKIHQFKRLQKQKENDYKRYKKSKTTAEEDGSPNAQRSTNNISRENQMISSSPSKKQSPPTKKKENYNYSWKQPISKHEKYSFAVAFDIEEIVSRAVSLLIAELKSGIYRHQDSHGDDSDNGSNENGSNVDKHKNDRNIANGEMNKLNAISVVLEQFAMEMIVPSIIASGVSEVKCISTDPAQVMKFRKQRHDRVFVSVLLNLREVMILNAEKFFSIKNNIMDDCNDDDIFRAYLCANTLILSAMQRLEPESVRESLLCQFEDAAQKYDTAHGDFASCLQRADACSLGVTPTGRELPREENIAWRISHNFTRNSHPLIQKQQLIDGFKPPSPNACYVSVVEKVASSSLEKQSPKRKYKIENESYVLEKHRTFMNRCMKAHNIEKL